MFTLLFCSNIVLICDLIENIFIYNIVYQCVSFLVTNPFRIHIWFARKL